MLYLFGCKKLFEVLLLPLSVGLFFLLIGLFLLWTREAKTLRNIAFILGFLTIFLFSISPIANGLLNPLQHRYPPLITLPGQVTTVVVLGGGTAITKQYPANLTLGSASLSRLVEGIRLFKMIENAHRHATLILSGGRAFQSNPIAGTLRNTAVMLGIPASQIVMESGSVDTAEEARYLQTSLGSKPFILVTSAYHMPRSMALFEKRGMHPIAAPTEFHGRGSDPFKQYLPNTSNLAKSDTALHEYLGMLFSKLKGLL